MIDNFKEKNSIFERHPIATIIFTVVFSIVALDILLTYAINAISNVEEKIRIKHPVYHHTFRANSKKIEQHRGNKYNILGGKKLTIFTNSLGFKSQSSREVSLKSANRRILFIGDSFTEGVSLKYEDTFVGLIDLALKNKQIEVLNAARSSYSAIIYWRKIKHLIEDIGLKFDEVVVYIDISDIQDEALNYDLSNDNIVITAPHQPTKPQLSLLGQIKKLMDANTTGVYRVLNLLYDSLPHEGGKWRKHLNHNRSKWTIDREAYNSYGKDGIELMKKYMNRLLNILKNNNIKLTIAVYPWPQQIWFDDLNSIQVDIWENWAQKNNVKFINYFPDFVKVGSSKINKIQTFEKYYLPGDAHFNKEGHKVLANKFIKAYFN